MRRLFIIRKDLNLSSGKLAAMVGHCAEVYWLNQMLKTDEYNGKTQLVLHIDKEIYKEYINKAIVKTICQSHNLNHLRKAEQIAKELGLKQHRDYGYINDKCLTELTPENEDGTTTVGIWFKPLSDEMSHKISKKFQLYRD